MNFIDYLDKTYDESYINNCFTKYYDLNKLKIDYWEDLIKKYNGFCALEEYQYLRYYYLNFNKMIKRLSIPWINIIYYKEEIENLENGKYTYFRKHYEKYRELYFYYFFQLIYQSFSIIDKTYRAFIDCFSLNNVNRKKRIESAVHDEFVNFSNGLEKESAVINLCNNISNYKNSTLEKLKEDYRNKDTHDFTDVIPKCVNDGNGFKVDNIPLDINDCFNDAKKMLKELENHLSLFNQIIKAYINKKLIK